MSTVQAIRRPFVPGHEGTNGHAPQGRAGQLSDSEDHIAGSAAAFRVFLESLGLDPDDPKLAGTDRRVARAYRELFAGLAKGAEPDLTVFPNTEGHAGIVQVSGIPFYSVCAHHFLPFFGLAHVGYLPGTRLVGLSKLGRVVDFYARRPQMQEDLTEQVASLLEQRIAPRGVIVMLEARHMCMEMRGVSKPNVATTTIAVRGMMEDVRNQQQFFARVRVPGASNAPSGI